MSNFVTDFGVHQGRIVRSDAPEGTHVYEFGHELLSDANVSVGEKHSITQTIQIDAASSAKFVRPFVRIVPPPRMTTGLVWEFVVILDSVELYVRKIRPHRIARVLNLTDIVVEVAGGPKLLELVLRVVADP